HPLSPLRSLFPFFFRLLCSPVFYTLSLHDALPISHRIGGAHRARRHPRCDHLAAAGLRAALAVVVVGGVGVRAAGARTPTPPTTDRKSTRLNSSHQIISYAVFCLKKKKTKQ